MVSRDFWRGRNVLVTGHTGFKGSWLATWLKELGSTVGGFSLDPPTQPSLFDKAEVARGLHRDVRGDIRDASTVVSAFEAQKPEIVFHLAAQPIVRRSYVDPIETYSTNVMGTVHVLEAARRAKSVRVVVIVTSDKCYENREWAWGYRESDRLGGRDPYSNSKACAELVTHAYRMSFFGEHEAGRRCAVASVRAGNVIGGGDWAEDRLIPDAVRAISSGEPFVLRHPQAVRPWQHVLDPLGGYLLLAEKMAGDMQTYSESWNFGPDADGARTVSDLVGDFMKQWGSNSQWKRDSGAMPHEAFFLKLDSSKTRARLGWRPRWSVDRAVAATVQWYRANQDGENMRSVTLKQIAEYEKGDTT